MRTHTKKSIGIDCPPLPVSYSVWLWRGLGEAERENISAETDFAPLCSARNDLKLTILFCCISFIFLRLAFPHFNFWIFSWLGLVPFFLALDGKSRVQGFTAGLFLGLLFFGGTLYWFVHVTFLGACLLILYLSLYFGFFGLGYVSFYNRPLWQKFLLLPSLWTALEFLRSRLFSGFGWVALGHSQYQNLPVIQIAEWTGVFGISFLIVLVNLVIKEGMTLKGKREAAERKEFLKAGAMVAAICLFVAAYGFWKISSSTWPTSLKAAVIQGNTSLEQRWTRSQWPNIVNVHLELTAQAAKEKPDLLIWPETSYPGFFADSPQLIEQIREFAARKQIPLLIGAVTQMGSRYFNSAVLVSSDGTLNQQYNKVHLVPFGEYIPFRSKLPFLEQIVPIDDFTSGGKYTLFSLFDENFNPLVKFGTLICFEDTVPEISRALVNAGAQFLINMTNDAWFKDSPEPHMHLQASVFRTIENRRTLIRAANTGVSGFIDPLGRLNCPVQNSKGKMTLITGTSAGPVFLNDQKTFYTKFGDIFTYLCFGCILWGILKKLNLKNFISSKSRP